MKFARWVFLFEAVVINAGVGLLCFFLPSAFVSQFSPASIPPANLELTRWYGVLLWVLAYAMLRVLPMNDHHVMQPVVEALLFGDLAHLAASYLFFRAVPVWSLAFVFMLGMSAFLAGTRIYWLVLYRRQVQAQAVA
jgi:hypothetical protein